MCSSHRPLNGADSGHPDNSELHRFTVELRETEGPSMFATIFALGKDDARRQARQMAREAGAQDVGVIRVEAA